MKSKESLYTIIGNFVYLFALWALTVIVVRFSTDYYAAGVLSLAMTITNIFYIIASYGVRAYQVSDINKKYTDQEYILSRIITIAVAFAACLVYTLLTGYRSAETFVPIMLYMVYKCFEAASDVFYGIFQNNDRYDYLCISMSVKGILSAVVFTLALMFGLSLSAAILAMIAVAFLTLLLLDIRWCLKFTKPLVFFNSKEFKIVMKMLASLAILIIIPISQPVLMSIPRVYFEQHFSTEQLGIYSSVSAPTVVITTFVTCAMMPYIPLFAKYYIDNDKKKLYRLTGIVLAFALAFGVFAFVIGYFFGEWGLQLLYGKSIAGHRDILLLVIIVTTLSAITLCMDTIFISIRKIPLPSVILIIGCVICWLITPYFVNTYEMRGVTYALILAQIFQVIGSMILLLIYFTKKKSPKLLEKES